MIFSFLDGVVLIHTNTGDLLRSLDPSEGFVSPKLISLNREGYIIVNYDKGGLCSFSINGKTLRSVSHNENVQVSLDVMVMFTQYVWFMILTSKVCVGYK